jgi:hypothetical protein
MSVEKKIAVVNFADLKGADGKTFRQSNMEKKHNIPVGTLVQIIETPDSDGCCSEWRGVRLYVAMHNRDCDGTPLYSLGSKGQTNTLMMDHGFGEDQLSVLEPPLKVIRGVEADWLRVVLNESATGHEEGCLHCAGVNEAVDHRFQDLPGDIRDGCKEASAIADEMEDKKHHFPPSGVMLSVLCSDKTFVCPSKLAEDAVRLIRKLRDYAIGMDASRLERVRKAIEMAIDMPLGNEDDGAPESIDMAFNEAFKTMGVPWEFGDDTITETGDWKEPEDRQP